MEEEYYYAKDAKESSEDKKKPSKAWYIVPILFGLIGGLVGYLVVKDDDRKMAKRISIINFKGGVGKTTLAFQLAAGLSKQSRVLIVDVDHQSSLSLVCLKEKQWQSAIDQEKTPRCV